MVRYGCFTATEEFCTRDRHGFLMTEIPVTPGVRQLCVSADVLCRLAPREREDWLLAVSRPRPVSKFWRREVRETAEKRKRRRESSGHRKKKLLSLLLLRD